MELHKAVTSEYMGIAYETYTCLVKMGNVERDWEKKRQQYYYVEIFKNPETIILWPPWTENSNIRNRKSSIYSLFKGSD